MKRSQEFLVIYLTTKAQENTKSTLQNVHSMAVYSIPGAASGTGKSLFFKKIVKKLNFLPY